MNAAERAGPGYFTVSFDFELIWGTLDTRGVNGFSRACAVERKLVIDRLPLRSEGSAEAPRNRSPTARLATRRLVRP
jgi:hypothetical protein